MTSAITPSDEGSCYEISLAGHLDDHWSTWFGGFAFTHEEDGTTTLRGLVADQAVLHGLLAKVRDLGATLISLTTVETVRPDSPEQQRPLARASPDSSLDSAPAVHAHLSTVVETDQTGVTTCPPSPPNDPAPPQTYR